MNETITYLPRRGSDGNHGTIGATYAQLTLAFHDGTIIPRDEKVSMATWLVHTPDGDVTIYDYRLGTCYAPDGAERCEIVRWHVDGDNRAAIATALERLGNANPNSPRDFG